MKERIAFVSKRNGNFHLIVDSANASELFAAHMVRTHTKAEDYDVFSSNPQKGVCRRATTILEEYRKGNLLGANGQLTTRETEIAELIGCGLRNKEIAAKVNLSVFTVKYHCRGIFRKLGMSNRIELLMFMKGGKHETS